MLVKKSNYIYKIKFTNANTNPVIFYLKSGVDISIDYNMSSTINSFYDNYLYTIIPKQPDCTVTLKNISLSNLIELNNLINNVLSGLINGIGYSLDYNINMEVKKGNQIIHVYNVMPSFDVPLQSFGYYGKKINITLKGDYAEFIYI